MNHPSNEADARRVGERDAGVATPSGPGPAATANKSSTNPFTDPRERATADGDNPDTIPIGDVPDALSAIQAELEIAQNKAEENWNLYLSLRAEMENLRKRSEREVQNAHKFALKDFVDALLPVKDSLEMGIAAAGETADVQKLLEGSDLTLKMLASVLSKFGVQEVNPQGEPFNPELHQAMAMQPSQQAKPNTVLQVVQKGYLLNERLIRPAMVIVAQAPR
ncbi:MAG: nucleotide exchange factor GrpE [Gammaproteobacteria bacterium]|nr:nucleotide exchange factor GrpE [Gammaproteobacteria bacterium]MCP5424333.1 nucleotide exchange factor GrpE [Gammaproteobacteria bacterium]MCP5459087.1 nucleotide exchange factor GrpE [Gammaproteobacteria bacterium]